MAIQHYSGQLGTFDYDDEQFEISNQMTMKWLKESINGELPDESTPECLRYIGKETDGHKITIPEGLVDGSCVFEGTGITSQPDLPSSLKVIDYMFAGCKDLKEMKDMPDNIVSAHSTWSYCISLEATGKFSKNLKTGDYAFDGCKSLKHVEPLPEGLETMRCMFANNDSLEKAVNIPSTVEDSYSAFYNCKNIPQTDDASTNYGETFDELYGDLTKKSITDFTTDFAAAKGKSYMEIAKSDEKRADIPSKNDVTKDKSSQISVDL